MNKTLNSFNRTAFAIGAMLLLSPSVQADEATRGALAIAPPAPVVKAHKAAKTGPLCTGTLTGQSSLSVPLGKSTLVNLPEPIRTRTVGNPAIVQAMQLSSQSLYVLGTTIGSTNMIVQGKSGACSVFDISVDADTSGLQQAIKTLLPEETGVQVKSAADALVLTGTVSDAVKAQRIVELAQRFVSGIARSVSADPGEKDAKSGADLDKNQERIINMLNVAAPQQVMLEVKVAEVSKTVLEKYGVNLGITGQVGKLDVKLFSDFLSSKSGVKVGGTTVNAQKGDQLVKILAEPNLMAVSGKKASFLAGGRVYIPVPQGFGTMTSSIIMEKEEYGVKLSFTPTVLENGRINLDVAPEVSELSPTGVTMSAGQSDSIQIMPLITTRNASTTIQIYDGQSFAISGLIKDNTRGDLQAVPALGNIPILGELFRSTEYQQDKSELVFIVTPHLVKALPAEHPMPADPLGKVSAGDLLRGNLEGKKPEAPAPAQAPLQTTDKPDEPTPTPGAAR